MCATIWTSSYTVAKLCAFSKYVWKIVFLKDIHSFCCLLGRAGLSFCNLYECYRTKDNFSKNNYFTKCRSNKYFLTRLLLCGKSIMLEIWIKNKRIHFNLQRYIRYSSKGRSVPCHNIFAPEENSISWMSDQSFLIMISNIFQLNFSINCHGTLPVDNAASRKYIKNISE